MGGIAISGLAAGMAVVATRPASTSLNVQTHRPLAVGVQGVQLPAELPAQASVDGTGVHASVAGIKAGIDTGLLGNLVDLSIASSSSNAAAPQASSPAPASLVAIDLAGINVDLSGITSWALNDVAGGTLYFVGKTVNSLDPITVQVGGISASVDAGNLVGGAVAGTLNVTGGALHFAGPVAGGAIDTAMPIVRAVPPLAGGAVAGTVNVVKAVDPIRVDASTGVASASASVDAFGTTTANVSNLAGVTATTPLH